MSFESASKQSVGSPSGCTQVEGCVLVCAEGECGRAYASTTWTYVFVQSFLIFVVSLLNLHVSLLHLHVSLLHLYVSLLHLHVSLLHLHVSHLSLIHI